MSETTTITISGKARQDKDRGKKANRRVRKAGWMPGIIYGHKQDPVAVLLPTRELELALRKGAHVLTIKLDGSEEQVLVKEVQFDHLSTGMMHVDMARVDLNERVKVMVQIVLRGTPKGAIEGGVLEQVLSQMEVECVVTQIPESLRLNVAELGVGQALHVKDVPLPEGTTTTSDLDTVVAVCRILGEEPVAEVAAVEGEPGATEPEVITRGKVEDEEGEEA
jgi:large subunit ribosomal protein L25